MAFSIRYERRSVLLQRACGSCGSRDHDGPQSIGSGARHCPRRRGIVNAFSQGPGSRSRTCTRPAEVRNAPFAGARGLPGVGRPRCGRPVVVGLRPRRSLQGARRTHALRSLPRDRDGRHRLHHLAGLQPDHRAVPDRGRRLSRRHVADRTVRGPHGRRRADRRLRADDRDLDRERNRRDVQPAAGRLAGRQALRRTVPRGRADHPQPARHARVDQDPAADLPRLRGHARHPHHLRHPQPRERTAEPGARHAERDQQAGQRDQLGVRGGAVPEGPTRSVAARTRASRRSPTTCSR